MANASVVTVRREKTAEPAKTAADGSFTLKVGGFMLVEEDLVASADGGRLMGLAKFVEPRKAGSAQPVRIVLKASRVTKVHVRDGKDQPVQGAAVAAIGFDFNGAATTDAGGEAAVRVPADAEVWWVAGLKAGAGFDYFENYSSWPVGKIGPLPADVTVRLDGSRTVRIKAVDTPGGRCPAFSSRRGRFGSWTARHGQHWRIADSAGADGRNRRGDFRLASNERRRGRWNS